MSEIVSKATEQVPGLVIFSIFAGMLVKAFLRYIKTYHAMLLEEGRHNRRVIEANTSALILNSSALHRVSKAMENCPAVKPIGG